MEPQSLASGTELPPQRPFWTWLGWASLFSALVFAAVVLAREFGDENKAVSAEAPTVAVDPAWINDDVFRWNGVEWTNVYGGCAHGCALSAVVAKTDACWRMATGDGSLYLGQRYVALPRFKGDARGVIIADDVPVAPAVTWKIVAHDGKRFRLHFRGTADGGIVEGQALQVVEVQTAAGVRLITKGGSFLIGPLPAAPMQSLPKPQ